MSGFEIELRIDNPPNALDAPIGRVSCQGWTSAAVTFVTVISGPQSWLGCSNVVHFALRLDFPKWTIRISHT